LKVLAEAADGHECLALIEKLQPDVAVVDIDMPGLDGFAVARAIGERKLPVEVIFLTVHREEDFLNEAISLGVKGYVLKDSAVSDIVTAIKAVAAGQHFTSPAMTTYLFSHSRHTQTAIPDLEDLTPAERRILRLIAEYKTNKMIADELFLSKRTVEKHREIICEKLGVSGSHALLKFALSHLSEL
jgi:DNA-binding NarL/FixJ family response regulator